MVFMNPFAKHDVSDFPGVYVPLAQAQRHPSVVAAHEDMKKEGLIPSKDEAQVEGSKGETDDYSAFTLESLRAEIDRGNTMLLPVCKPKDNLSNDGYRSGGIWPRHCL